ncbi:hypothetical protein AB205_0058610 [Aquarana catesbeiana]|uniref:Uncharacterized protein n=1 Tax=Aquarana catesbeiana TaxID=8400 RepID=A0A2G9Q9D5_AQUCT|nr:hypothetical protein AB205_0058610 [Aquarana catesbeiana]
MDISSFDNATPKIVIQQTCWFVLKTVSKCTCDCVGIKKFVNQECVDYCLNATTLLWRCNCRFLRKWWLFPKGKSSLHYKSIFSAVSRALVV